MWPEETRKVFESKVIGIVALGRNFDANRIIASGANPSPVLHYKLPFLRYEWKANTKSGQFVISSPTAFAHVSPYSCHLDELGIEQTMLGYPHFVAAWKPYHEKYLKPLMSADGALEFKIETVENRMEKSP